MFNNFPNYPNKSGVCEEYFQLMQTQYPPSHQVFPGIPMNNNFVSRNDNPLLWGFMPNMEMNPAPNNLYPRTMNSNDNKEVEKFKKYLFK